MSHEMLSGRVRRKKFQFLRLSQPGRPVKDSKFKNQDQGYRELS
jgi:hypothetical protein